MEGAPAPVRLRLERLAALSDGVIAIVMTLLVLSIEVPKGHDFSRAGLAPFLEALAHDVVIYAVSFLVVGGYWVHHHSLLHFARYSDRGLVWLHLLFLVLVSLVPFTTQLKAAYRQEASVLLILCGLHMGIVLMLGAIGWYLERRTWLLRRAIDPAIARSIRARIFAGEAICIAAALGGFVSVRWGPMILLGMPLLYLSNRRVDLHGSDPEDRAEGPDAPA